eukprot:5027619-Amphidinium_carterae.1
MPLSVLQWASLHQLSRFLLLRAVPLSRECHRPCRVPTTGVCTRRTGGATCFARTSSLALAIPSRRGRV